MIPGDGVRVDVAFETVPDDPNPAWVDVTDHALMTPGISITRGRSPEGGSVTPGMCSLTLTNDDGRFTAENVSSPYYPNVTLYRRLRVSWRDPDSLGQFNLAGSLKASTEDGSLAGWWAAFFGSDASTITADGARAFSGTKSVRVDWPTTTNSVGAGVFLPARQAKGRTYVASVRVWVPTGSPAVSFGDVFGGTPVVSSTVVNAWQQLTIAFTAGRFDHYLGVRPVSAPTAGQRVWVDAIQVDEAAVGQFPAASRGSGPAFTTSAPVEDVDVSDRFVGFVDAWPTSWPSGPDLARAEITATDRLKRIGRRQRLRSIVEQEFLADSPNAYFPLGEPEGSSSAGDLSGRNLAGTMTQVQYGAGGSIAFGAGTGPGTDSLTAPVLSPVDASNGRSLRSTAVSPLNPAAFFTSGLTAECFVSTSSTSRTILELRDSYSQRIALEVSPTGKLRVVADASSFFGSTETADSASNVSNGATRHVAITGTSTEGGSVIRAWLDGVNVATLSTGGVFTWLPAFVTLEVGGRAGQMLAGTVSHVAVYGAVLSSTRIAAHYEAGASGFAGESSDQRVARYAGYAGVSAADMDLDAGASTSIAHVDTTDQAALDLSQRVAETESGVLFVDRSGLLAFHSRTRRYNATAAELPSAQLRPDLGIDYNDQGVVNDVTASRDGGISYRATDVSSIEQFGDLTDSLSLLTTSDAEVADAAHWRVQTRATPRSRVPAVALEILEADSATRAAALALDVSSRIAVPDMPAQAPAAVLDLFVEGYSEVISASEWSLRLNTSTADKGRVWQLGVTGSSELGTTTRLTY